MKYFLPHLPSLFSKMNLFLHDLISVEPVLSNSWTRYLDISFLTKIDTFHLLLTVRHMSRVRHWMFTIQVEDIVL